MEDQQNTAPSDVRASEAAKLGGQPRKQDMASVTKRFVPPSKFPR
jgi:hypothetical protein